MAHLFISYASSDQAMALEVCALLEAQGIGCWIAPRDVAPGAKWDEAIVDAITSSSAFLLVLTAAANASQYVSNEVNHAFAANKPIFTFRAEDVQPSKSLGFYLARHRWTEGFAGRRDEHVAQLAAAVRGMPAPVPASRPRRGGRTWRYVAVLLGVLVAAGSASLATALMLRRTGATPRAVRFAVAPPPDRIFTGSGNNGVAVSPDGRMVAFAVADQSVSSLWVRQLDTLEAEPLDGTLGARGPFWSPDSESVAFFVAGELKVARRDGGAVRTIASVPPGATGGTWRGDVIVFAAGPPDGGLLRVAATGGTPTLVVQPIGGSVLAAPELLPDGRTLVYYAPGAGELRLAALDGGASRRLRDAESQAIYADGHLLFVSGGVLVAQQFDADSGRLGQVHPLPDRPLKTDVPAVFSVAGSALALRPDTAGALTQLRWADRQGRVTGDIGEPAAYRNPTLSPDEGRLAVERFDPAARNWDIWIIDLARGSAFRLTDLQGDERRPLWSSDGAWVAFVSVKDGKAVVLRQRADGGGAAEPLQALEATGSLYDITPRDELLINVRAEGDRFVLAPLSGEASRPVARLGPVAVVAPNGGSVVFNRRIGERWELVASAFPEGGGVTQITADGGIRARFTPDGRELIYFRLSDRHLVSVPVLGPVRFGPPAPLFEPHALMDEAAAQNFLQQYDITRDGRFILKFAG